MIILQDRGVFAQLVEFDPDSKHIDRRARGAGEAVRMSGWIGRIGNDDVLFYKCTGTLHLFVGGRTLPANETKAHLTVHGKTRRFEMACGGDSILDVTYSEPTISPPISDFLSPGESEEDYDYALFLKNVLNDPARLAVCLEVWA
jgi:hypothetical protein